MHRSCQNFLKVFFHKNYPSKNLTFVGLVSLEDPPKHGVREAIGNLRMAGIKVMMVTGDHPLTAEAIGRKINLMISDTKELVAKNKKIPIEEVDERAVEAIVIHGEKIDSLTDEDWDLIFSKREIIFARTSPKHKLQIVKRAQAIGHIVGVTGDGVNDSPALKKADLGIAMNESGSDVSKEAASMVLLDDNFASTFKGIEEGFPGPQKKEVQPKQDLGKKHKQFPEKTSSVKKPIWKKTIQQPPQIVVKQGKGQKRPRFGKSFEEKKKLMLAGKCFICEEKGHIALNCPHKSSKDAEDKEAPNKKKPSIGLVPDMIGDQSCDDATKLCRAWGKIRDA